MIFLAMPTQDELQHVPPDDDYKVLHCATAFSGRSLLEDLKN